MRHLELTRLAVDALGEAATSAEIAAYAGSQLAAFLDPRFVSLYRATLRGQEHQRLARAAAARVIEEARLEPQCRKRKTPEPA